jgi:N6-L-threonylcarbamoyladenine synthase
MIVLAIETSCDETSVAIVKDGKKVLSNIVLSQIDIHADFGGVVPEVASRHHIENITIVIEEALKSAGLNLDDIDSVAVTYGPGLIGSLLIGLQAAKTLSLVLDKPLIPVHHIAGHIYASNIEHELSFPLIALVVSGGHTDILYMKEHYSFEKVGSTLDDAIGEAYDKVARVLELGYPGGPKIDKLAKEGKYSYNLPTPKDDDTYDFSFSGLKSAVINLVHKEKQNKREINKADLATSFQEVAINILVKKTIKAALEKNVNQIVLAGGVAANTRLRYELKKRANENNIEVLIPSFEYCTDNAAMIGAAANYAPILVDNVYEFNAKASERLYE